MKYYFDCFRKYYDFSGRARRREYWTFTLINVGIGFVLRLGAMYSIAFYIISIVFGLVIIIPTLAATVRRLHDIGKSGTWLFIGMIPLVGGIWLLILTTTDSDSLFNEYGESQKKVEPEY